MELNFSRTALQDLHRIKEFIYQKNPAAAKEMQTALLKGLRLLAVQPEIGTSYQFNIRQWICGNYVTRYIIKTNSIYILRIWHQKNYAVNSDTLNNISIHLEQVLSSSARK